VCALKAPAPANTLKELAGADGPCQVPVEFRPTGSSLSLPCFVLGLYLSWLGRTSTPVGSSSRQPATRSSVSFDLLPPTRVSLMIAP